MCHKNIKPVLNSKQEDSKRGLANLCVGFSGGEFTKAVGI